MTALTFFSFTSWVSFHRPQPSPESSVELGTLEHAPYRSGENGDAGRIRESGECCRRNAGLTTALAEQRLHSMRRILHAAFGMDVARPVTKAAHAVGRAGGSGGLDRDVRSFSCSEWRLIDGMIL